MALEQGRARLLAEALEESRRDLERLAERGHGELLARYRAAADADARRCRRSAAAAGGADEPPGSASGLAAEALEAARAELDAAIAAIREVAGYEDFFRPPTWEKIAAAWHRACRWSTWWRRRRAGWRWWCGGKLRG